MTDDTALPHLNVHDAEYQPLPAYGGAQAILYRSPDGRRIAGSFRESGKHSLTMAYDEFLFVIAGSATLTVHGDERLTLVPGDACYLRQGSTVDFEMSPDFHDVAVLMSDDEIRY